MAVATVKKDARQQEADVAAASMASGLCAVFSWCFQVSTAPDVTPTTRSPARAVASSDGGHVTSLQSYQQPPAWVDDAAVGECSLCSDRFDLIVRKHHCRACGLVYCKSCASRFERVIKYGLVTPVRVCNACYQLAQCENEFYERHLPVLEAGDVLTKYGLLRKRHVEVKYVAEKGIFQYQGVDLNARQYYGEIKAFALDRVLDVKRVVNDPEHQDVGFVVYMVDKEEHRLDASSEHKRDQWVQAMLSARDVRQNLIALEREKQEKLLAKERDEVREHNHKMQQLQERKASFQEDRLRKRALQRESLRAKYKLDVTSPTSA